MNLQPAKLPAPTSTGAMTPVAPATSDSASAELATSDPAPASLWTLLKQVHRDERGGVSIETILIIAAIALPILIFIIKFGWPRIRKFFNEGMDELEGGALDAAGGE